MGEPDLAPLDDFASARRCSRSQRQGGGADGHQRRAWSPRATPSTWRWSSCATLVKRAAGQAGEAAEATAEAEIAEQEGARPPDGPVLQGPEERRARSLGRARHRQGRASRVDAGRHRRVLGRLRQGPYERWSSWRTASRRQAADADLLFLRYVGTDLAGFQKSFDRMKIVDGTAIPPGKRGFLFAKSCTRSSSSSRPRGGSTRSRRRRERGKTIATDPELQRWCARTATRCARSCCSWTPQDRDSAQLQQRLGSQEDVGKLLAAFFEIDDRTSPRATSSSTRSWRRCWSCTGCASATR